MNEKIQQNMLKLETTKENISLLQDNIKNIEKNLYDDLVSYLTTTESSDINLREVHDYVKTVFYSNKLYKSVLYMLILDLIEKDDFDYMNEMLKEIYSLVPFDTKDGGKNIIHGVYAALDNKKNISDYGVLFYNFLFSYEKSTSSIEFSEFKELIPDNVSFFINDMTGVIKFKNGRAYISEYNPITNLKSLLSAIYKILDKINLDNFMVSIGSYKNNTKLNFSKNDLLTIEVHYPDGKIKNLDIMSLFDDQESIDNLKELKNNKMFFTKNHKHLLSKIVDELYLMTKKSYVVNDNTVRTIKNTMNVIRNAGNEES